MAVATGAADVVVCYRAFNERSGRRFGAGVQDIAPVGATPSGRTSAGTRRWAADSRVMGRDVRPALHARVRRHERGLRPRRGGRPQARRHQPGGLVLRAARSRSRNIRTRAGSPSRCTCSTAARRPTAARRWSSPRRACKDLPTAPASSRASPRARRDQHMMTSYYRDDIAQLPEMGVVARQLWGSRACPGRHPDGDPLRPLHPVRADAAGGVRLLRAAARRKDFVRDGASRSAAGCRSTPMAASSARPTSTA